MTLSRAIGTLIGLNAVGAVVGVGGTLVTIHLFGTTRELEVFFAATTLQQVLIRFIQGGQLSEAFLPVYHRLKNLEGLQSARTAFAIVLNWTVIVTLVVAVLVWFGSPMLLNLLVPGFSEGDRELGVSMSRAIILIMPFQVMGAMVRGLLNAEKYFGKPESMAVAAQVLSIALLVLCVPYFEIWAMIVALAVSQLFLNGGFLVMLKSVGYRHQWRLQSQTFRASEVFVKLWYTSGQMASAQLMAIALNASLSVLPQGSYAVFRYVRQVTSKISTLLLRPISTVFFTHFAEAMTKDPSKVKALARSAMSKSLLLVTGATVTLIACAEPLLGGLWASSKFPPDQVRAAAGLMVFMTALFIPQAAFAVLRKLLVSAGQMGPMYSGIALVQLGAAILFWAFTSKVGLQGLVMILALTYSIQVGFAWWLLARKRKDLLFTLNVGHFVRCLLAGVIVGMTISGLNGVLGWSNWSLSRMEAVSLAATLSVSSVLMLMVVGCLLRLPELLRIYRFGSNWLQRGASLS